MKSENQGLHLMGRGEGSTTGLQYSLLQNFGELEFDWRERTVSIRAIRRKETKQATVAHGEVQYGSIVR